MGSRADLLSNLPTNAGNQVGSISGAGPSLADLTRPDFPLLAQTACSGQPLIYLDHAATSQKPRQVLATLQHYYDHDNANVHRGAHQLSARATEAAVTAPDTSTLVSLSHPPATTRWPSWPCVSGAFAGATA